MNLANVLKIINKMQNSIDGNCKVYICSRGENTIRFIIDWIEGFRLNHAVDIIELSSQEEETLTLYLIDKCNRAYRDEVEKRRKHNERN